MQEPGEITSALCDIHMILTHPVGIEMTQSIGLRRHAENLEDLALHTVIGLTDVVLLVEQSMATLAEFVEFKDLLEEVSKMILRDGPGSELQEQRRKRLQILKPRCDRLAQKIEWLSEEEILMEDQEMHLM